jgi:hypothetical protein
MTTSLTHRVDWAGQTVPYTEPVSGKEKSAYVFVAVLPASAYPFVYVYGDTKLPNWIDGHVRAYEYFGGIPNVTVPDNTKTAVTTPDLFDPVLNRAYNEMARHYGTTIIPARGYRPKDKAAVENMVGNVSRRVLAPIRNRQFFSIHEINQAVAEELKKFVNRPFQKIKGNRLTAFNQIDKPHLKPLPATRYEYSDWKEARVQFNYHVEYDGFFYSVHYSYAGQMCSVRASAAAIEVYLGNERVAAHKRNHNAFRRYTTLPDHIPEEHKIVTGWNNDRFLLWAQKIGPNTKELIQHILDSREYSIQTYRSCMGIMRLAKDIPDETMENASREALLRQTYSYKYFSMILRQMVSGKEKDYAEKIIQHDNVRGSDSFTGDGIHA